MLDALPDASKINDLSRIDSLNNRTYFFTDNLFGSEGLFLLRKESLVWKAYVVELMGPNTVLQKFKMEDGGFVSITACRFPSGVCETVYCETQFIHINNLRCFSIVTYREETCHSETGESTAHRECSTGYTVTNKRFKIIPKRREGDIHCTEGAEYVIGNEALIPLH